MKIRIAILLLFVSINPPVQSQNNFSIEANVFAVYSKDDTSPFWFYSNRRGRIDESTQVATWLTLKKLWKIGPGSSLEFGAGGLYKNESPTENFIVDELYGQYSNQWLRLVAGLKHYDEYYNGLSATSGNLLWSLNARPLPGIELKVEEPIYFLFDDHLGLSGSWGEYLMGQDRFVKNARLHKKSLYLNYKSENDFRIKLGIEHFVQWAGETPEEYIGKIPKTFKDYLRIVAGQGGGEDSYLGEQTNALGNHLGTYELRIFKEFEKFNLELFYSHLFDDGSGMLFYNAPDGLYGFFVDFNKNGKETKWINQFLYEFYYTKEQSHQRTPFRHIWDNYLNNGMYQSGWTYKSNVIGLPFFTLNKYDNEPVAVIGNNRILVHHLGVNGDFFNKFPYKFLFSYRNNSGHVRSDGDTGENRYPLDDPRGSFNIAHEIISTYMEVEIIEKPLNISLELGADFSENNNNPAVGILITKRF